MREGLSEADLSWLACAIDGEGSLLLRREPFGAVELGVYNTCRAFVEKAQSIMGGTIRVSQRGVYKPLYRVVLTHRIEVKGVLQHILPYLTAKKGRAVEALSFIDGREWGHTSKESRAKLSFQTRKGWNNPAVRARRIDGLKLAWKRRKDRLG